MKYRHLLKNGIWLTIPILLWNILFANQLPAQYLPDIFWQAIPLPIQIGENFFRIMVFAMPVFFTINMTTKTQKQGMRWYVGGTAVYFLSWIPLMLAPESVWSQSIVGFMAPAYTPLLLFVGIGLLGERFYFSVRYRPIYYLFPAVLFTIFHCTHVAIIYGRNF